VKVKYGKYFFSLCACGSWLFLLLAAGQQQWRLQIQSGDEKTTTAQLVRNYSIENINI
jgi:hypothetical protein